MELRDPNSSKVEKFKSVALLKNLSSLPPIFSLCVAYVCGWTYAMHPCGGQSGFELRPSGFYLLLPVLPFKTGSYCVTQRVLPI